LRYLHDLGGTPLAVQDRHYAGALLSPIHVLDGTPLFIKIFAVDVDERAF